MKNIYEVIQFPSDRYCNLLGDKWLPLKLKIMILYASIAHKLFFCIAEYILKL